MSFWLLFIDELRGFYKSKVMLVLWIGFPLVSILFHYLQPDMEGIPLTYMVGLLISSMGGILAAVMLATSIVSEKNRHVYDLFLIRPVKHANLLLSKLLAVYICLVIAAALSFIVGFCIDYFLHTLPTGSILTDTLESVVVSLVAMAISCSIGLLIGILVKSVALASILAIYLGGQLSLVLMLPSFFIEFIEPFIYAPIIAVCTIPAILIITILLFERKQI